MSKIQLTKGNLYNQLEDRIDKSLLDSNQYDLEIMINGKSEYYRVRLSESRFEAVPIKLEKKDFYLPENSRNCSIYELGSFRKTEFYKKYFPYRSLLIQSEKRMDNKRYLTEYYYYLQDVSKKNNIVSNSEYSFSIPAINEREEFGVLSYDVSIERARKYYYLVFLKEHMKKDYYQGDEELYMIYSRKNFLKKKQQIEDKVLQICLEMNSPLVLTELLYISIGNHRQMLNKVYEEIERAKRRQDFDLLLRSGSFQVLKPVFMQNDLLLSELCYYVNGHKDDIEYNFKQRILGK